MSSSSTSTSALTLTTINNDCLRHILAHLPLVDLLSVRSVCWALNNAVQEFLPCVDTLPVYLAALKTGNGDSEQYSDIARQISFGRRHTAFVEQLEDPTILSHQRHFRPEDFIVIPDIARFEVFVRFVRKNLPKITKLAVIINSSVQTSQVCKLYNDSLTVLFLEQTLLDESNCRPDTHVDESFYSPILSLPSLEELYFFPKENSSLVIDDGLPARPFADEFFNTVVSRLTVFHLNFQFTAWTVKYFFEFDAGRTYEKLRELKCQSELTIEHVEAFPNIRKLHFIGGRRDLNGLNTGALKSLQYLSVSRALEFDEKLMDSLNRLPNLVELCCEDIDQSGAPVIDQKLANKTIKRITLDADANLPTDAVAELCRGKEQLPWWTMFKALDSVAGLKPEVTE